MRFFCDNCKQKIECNHYWKGMTVTCPGCGKFTDLVYEEGQKIPNTEYSISFKDFRQLVTNESYSKRIYPFVQKHLQCSIVRTSEGIRLFK
jgi:hypothetical protein